MSIADAVAVEKRLRRFFQILNLINNILFKQINITQDLIEIIFLDHLGTMKKTEASIGCNFS